MARGVWRSALTGVLLGATAATGTWTASWWSERLPWLPQPATTTPALSAGLLAPCRAVALDCVAPASLSAAEQELLARVAVRRRDRGCGALRLDPRLGRAAAARAQAVVRGAALSATDPGLLSPTSRASAWGYDGHVEETVAVGASTARLAMAAWLQPAVAPGLQARLDDCRAVAVGVAFDDQARSAAFGPGVWVLMLGRPHEG